MARRHSFNIKSDMNYIDAEVDYDDIDSDMNYIDAEVDYDDIDIYVNEFDRLLL